MLSLNRHCLSGLRVALGLFVFSAALLPLRAEAGQSSPASGGRIVEGKSAGPISLGETRSSVTSEWGTGVRTGTQQVYFEGSGEVRVFFNSNNRVTQIHVIDLPQFETTRGINTNDFRHSFKAVDKAYPEARIVGGGRLADGVVFQKFQSYTRGLYTKIIVR